MNVGEHAKHKGQGKMQGPDEIKVQRGPSRAIQGCHLRLVKLSDRAWETVPDASCTFEPNLRGLVGNVSAMTTDNSRITACSTKTTRNIVDAVNISPYLRSESTLTATYADDCKHLHVRLIRLPSQIQLYLNEFLFAETGQQWENMIDEITSLPYCLNHKGVTVGELGRPFPLMAQSS